MKTMIALLLLSLTSCAVDDLEDTQLAEAESDVTGTVICTGTGGGTCTASSSPSGWTITTATGVVTLSATTSKTVGWSCWGTGFRTVTAVGVGSAQVHCSRL